MAWEIHHRKGVWLPQIGWWLDAQSRAERSFVSHAHGDHIARHKEVLCTAATARLLHARLPGRRAELTPPFGRAQALDFGTTATLHPAGHIVGSSQILLEHGEHGSLLYTGDFKLRPGLAAEPCTTPHADVLIMETTFGLPRYVFPPESETVARVIEFCRQAVADGITPVLLCYSLGKSQEVLRALAPANLPVVLAETLNGEVQSILGSIAVRAQLRSEGMGMGAGGGSPAQVTRVIEKEIRKYYVVVKRAELLAD